MNISEYVLNQANLAAAFARDGAMHTAASILVDAATVVKERADQADAFILAMIAKGKLRSAIDNQEADDPVNLAGSGPTPIEPRG